MESALDDHVEQERHRSLGLRVDVWESANEVSPKVGLARGKSNQYVSTVIFRKSRKSCKAWNCTAMMILTKVNLNARWRSPGSSVTLS